MQTAQEISGRGDTFHGQNIAESAGLAMRLLVIGLACVLIAIAFRSAWLATHDLDWPYDYDLFRDAAFAQNIADGHFPADAYYAGEWNWYNPLAPAVVGAIARLVGEDAVRVYARDGAIIALAIPLGIFALGAALVGRWAGLASLFAFLFLGPNNLPGWAAPSYSPWLFANSISVIPLALTLIAALRAHRTGRLHIWCACGILLGLTFLTHTAAAILGGCIALVLAWERGKMRAVILRWLLLIFLALIVSSPFLATIAGHYHLQILNTAGLDFVAAEMELHYLPTLLRGSFNFANAAALAGFILLLRDRRMKAARRALLVWLALCLLMLVFAFARQAWPALNLPSLVPSFHWLFHLRIARAFLFGYAFYRGAAGIILLLDRWRKLPVAMPLVSGLLVLLIFNYPLFLGRFDFGAAREVALEIARTPGFAETVDWLRHETPNGAVVLAQPVEGLLLLGAAGRKTVLLEPTFSNPYVAIEPRATAAAAMANSLARMEGDNFLRIAAAYHVSYVLLSDPSPAFADQYRDATFVTKVFGTGYYSILRVEQRTD